MDEFVETLAAKKETGYDFARMEGLTGAGDDPPLNQINHPV